MRRLPKRARRGHGEGGVTFRTDKKLWEASVALGPTSQGGIRRRQLYARTKSEALQKLRELQSQRDLGVHVEPSRLTVAQYFENWLVQIVRPSVRPSTLRDYKRYVNSRILPAIGSLQLRRLTAPRIQSVLAELEERHTSAALRRKVYVVLSSALRQAQRLGYLPNNVCFGVTPPRVPRREMLFLTSHQVAILLHVAENDRFFALIVLAATIGLRQGELFGLRWTDISLTNHTLTVSRSVAEDRITLPDGSGAMRPVICEPKTHGSKRTIRLPKVAADALRKHRREMLAEGHLEYVFCDTAGGLVRKSNFLRRHWKPLTDLLEEAVRSHKGSSLRGLRFHDLRHTAASLRLSLGDNIKVVQELLGHSTIRTTGDLYGHLAQSVQEESSRRLDGELRRAAGSLSRRAK